MLRPPLVVAPVDSLDRIPCHCRKLSPSHDYPSQLLCHHIHIFTNSVQGAAIQKTRAEADDVREKDSWPPTTKAYGTNKVNYVCPCDMLSAMSHTPYALRLIDAVGGGRAEATETEAAVQTELVPESPSLFGFSAMSWL